MSGLLQDLRFAFRQLRKGLGFTVTAVAMLAMAICANSTVFSWMDGTMLHPIPGARDSGALVSIMRGQWSNSPSPPLSYPDYRDLRELNHSFSGILGYNHDWLTLTDGATPYRFYVANVSANYFDLLGVRPMLGRFFRPEEETQPRAIPYVILSYSLWKTRYAGNPAMVGKSIEIAHHTVTVIGVAPQNFIGAMPGIREDAWLTLDPIGTNAWRMTHRSPAWLDVIGRLKPDVSRKHATKDLETIMGRIAADDPKDHLGVNTITLDPMWRSPFGANIYLSSTLPILLGIAGVVLLLTCANVATLMLVRFVARRTEIAIRQALGGKRTHLVRQMVLESILVSLCGGVVALLLTSGTSKTFARFIPPNSNPIVLNGIVDHNVVIATVLLAALASLLCGALPAWRSSHVGEVEVLKQESSRVAGGKRNRHLLNALVVAQIGLSLALLVCSGLFLRTLRNISHADPGFEQDHVLTASVGVNIAGYPEDVRQAMPRRILDRVAALPAATVASLTDWVPFSFTRKTVDAYPEGYSPRLHESLEVRRADVTPRYFETLNLQILEGRDFALTDDKKAPRVLIVDETAAKRYWPHQDPLGKRLSIWGRLFTVIGVVKNSRHQFVNEPSEPMVYMSYFQEPDSELIVQVRTRGNAVDVAPAVERAIHELDTGLPVYDVRSLRESTQISSMFAVMESTFAGIFAVIALILAATGIYGVVSYRTQLRTHEIGIRVALGASRAGVLRLVLLQGLWLTASGLGLGLVLAFGMTRFIARLLYGISPNDPLTVLVVMVVLGALSVLACYSPALRAMRSNPVAAIREQ